MQSDYENTCRTYKELILEVVDTHLHPPADYPWWQEEDADYAHWREKYKEVVGFESEKGKFVHLERINSIDEEFKNVVGRLVRIKRAFLGYDIGGGHLAKNWYDVSNWIDSIKNTHGLTDPLDIRNAICNEMVRQEKEKGLVLDTPGARDEVKSAYRFEVKEQDVWCNGGEPFKAEPRLASILNEFISNPGVEVKMKRLQTVSGLNSRVKVREAVRDLVCWLKDTFKIDIKILDKMFEPTLGKNRKYVAYTYHSNIL